MSDPTDENEYGLVMPFVTTASNGGPHDDESYTAGWEMGALDAYLFRVKPDSHVATIHAANVQQADLIAMRHGYGMNTINSEADVDGWETVIFTGGGHRCGD